MTKTTAPTLPRRAAIALLSTSLVTLALAIFQWIELVIVRHGGSSICAVNAHVNCEAVWNSDFASRVHHLTGVPVAALGVIWSLTAFVLSFAVTSRAKRGNPFGVQTLALRMTAAVGVLSIIPLAIGSFRASALCLLCLGTYVLVALFAFFTFAWVPGPAEPVRGETGKALGWAVVTALVAYLIVLPEGLLTPHAPNLSSLPSGSVVTSTVTGATSAPTQAADTSALAQFLARLPDDQRQAVSDSLALWRNSSVQASDKSYAPAARVGDASAPVQVVEFTDIACPHCRHLVETMAQLRRLVAPQQMAVESRYYPLDAECNPSLPPNATDHSGLRCLGAKVQICLEKAPDFVELRDKLFENQAGLTTDKLMELASSGSVPRSQLEACVKSPATSQRLQQDIQYAMAYKIEGTPLVLINGKEGTPIPAFLYAMALAGGNANAPAFASLPPPDLSAFGQ